MTVKMAISLTDEQHAYARSLVADGQFASVSAVLKHGLELLRQRADSHVARSTALQALIDDRRAGSSLPLEDVVNFIAAVERED